MKVKYDQQELFKFQHIPHRKLQKTWNIAYIVYRVTLQCFYGALLWWSLKPQSPFTSIVEKEHCEHSSQLLLLCSMEKRKLNSFEMTWAWVTDDKMLICSWATPLSFPLTWVCLGICVPVIFSLLLIQHLILPQPTRSSSESICSRPGSSIPGSPGHTIYVSPAHRRPQSFPESVRSYQSMHNGFWCWYTSGSM